MKNWGLLKEPSDSISRSSQRPKPITLPKTVEETWVKMCTVSVESRNSGWGLFKTPTWNIISRNMGCTLDKPSKEQIKITLKYTQQNHQYWTPWYNTASPTLLPTISFKNLPKALILLTKCQARPRGAKCKIWQQLALSKVIFRTQFKKTALNTLASI